MADLILDMDWDISKAEAKRRKLDREFELSKQKAENIRKEIKQTADNIEQSKKRQKQFNDELDRSSQKLEAYEHSQINLTDKQVKAEVKNNAQIQKRIEKEEAYQMAQSKTLAKQNILLNTQNNKTAEIGDKIVSSSKKQINFGKAIKGSTKPLEAFSKRISGLVKRVFVFTLITKALRAMRDALGSYISQDSKLSKSIAQLKGNLATIGATISSSLAPYIKWFIDKLVYITSLLGQTFAKLLGKDINQMKKLASATSDTADAAEKATAGFDTLQTLSGSQSSTSAATSVDTSAMLKVDDSEVDEFIKKIKALIPLVTTVGALLLTWKITSFLKELGVLTGSKQGGIMFLVAGIGLIVSGILDWIENGKSLSSVLTIVVGILSVGLGLMMLGLGWPALLVAAIVAAVVVIIAYWNEIKSAVSNFIEWFSDKVLDKLFGKGVGDALQGMWMAFTQTFEDIIYFFKCVFTGKWKEAGKALVNILIDLLNFGIEKFNSFIQFFLGGGAKIINAFGKLFGQKWNLDASGIKIPTIPRLATGAVLPGGSPMLAWVNDQPKGQGYVEGSIDNIAAAFEKYLGDKGFGNQNITLEAKGSMAQLIRLLNIEIKKENTRSSIWG